MGHRHSQEPKTEPKQVVSVTDDSERSNPFLSNNDLTLLSLVTPFLSPNGQKLISFFVNFNHSSLSSPDFSGIQNQSGNFEANKLLQDLLPTLLGLTGKINREGFDPSLLASLLGMFNNSTPQSNQGAAD